MAFWYIDPTIGTADESDAYNGGLGERKLRDSWADVTWTAKNTYAQRRGTTYTGVVTVSGSGSAGSPITLGAYGTGDRPKVNGNGSSFGSIYMTGRSYIDISNFELYGSAGGGSAAVHILNTDHVSVTDCYAHDSRQGFRIDNTGSAEKAGFRFTRCVSVGTSNNGFSAVCGSQDGGTLRDITLDSCESIDSGSSGTGYGIFITTRLSNSDAYDDGYVAHDVKIKDCLVSGTAGYGVALRYVTGGYVRDTEITRACVGNDQDTHSLWFAGCRGFVVSGNHIHHNGGWSGAASGSGVGIFIDQGSTTGTGHACQRMKVIGNHIHHQFNGPNTGNTASAAISIYRSEDTAVSGNLIHDCRYGISVRGAATQNTSGTKVANNTCVDIEQNAYSVANLADETVVRNNIALRAAVGFFEESGANAVTNVTREYNSAYDCDTHLWATGTLASLSADTANTGDIEDDPLLTPSYGLQAASPCRGAGIYIRGAKHFGGHSMSVVSPDIGAFRYFAPRTTIMRHTASR